MLRPWMILFSYFFFGFSFLALLLSLYWVAQEPYVGVFGWGFGSFLLLSGAFVCLWGASGVLSVGVLIGLGCS